jgi:nucleotide-binding universal stress UspA family protein
LAQIPRWDPTGKESVTRSIFPTRILLATDGSEEAELATLRAVDMAEKTDSELHVVHVGVVPLFLESYRYPGTLGYDRKLYEQIEEESREQLRKLSWRVKVAGGTVAGSHLRMGAVDLEIRRAIEGSISDAVIRHAPCPVLVVRSHERAETPERHPIIHVGG